MFATLKTVFLTVVLIVLAVFWHVKMNPGFSLNAAYLPPSLEMPAEILNLSDDQTLEPIQIPVKRRDYITEDYLFTPVAQYSMQNRILSKKRYRDHWKHIAPVDLVLAWGPMTRQDVLDNLDYSQSNRWWWYRFEYNKLPINPNTIQTHAANVHIIPANETIWKTILKEAKAGKTFRANGYLVQIRAPGGGYWNSSESRTDTGDGACEVFLVTDCEIY